MEHYIKVNALVDFLHAQRKGLKKMKGDRDDSEEVSWLEGQLEMINKILELVEGVEL